MPVRYIVCETDRLVVRVATEQDVDVFYELWTDARVMANVGFPQGLRVTRQEIEHRLRQPFESEFDRLLVVELKGSGEVIGECYMHIPDDEEIAETDVKLLPAFWGHKYGVEVKSGLVSHLFTNTECIAIKATPNVANVASIQMQKAVGAVRAGEAVYEFPESMRDYTTPVHYYTYRVDRRAWEEAQAAADSH